jgi:hypothetical protein
MTQLLNPDHKTIRTVLRQHGLTEGRMISDSKTRYCGRNRDHFVVVNAQIFSARGRVLKQVDLDLTVDGHKLSAAARLTGVNLWVLYEGDPSPDCKTGSTPVSRILRNAIWWTRIHPRDADLFLPLISGPLWGHIPLRCVTGEWQGKPAFSVDLWSNPDYESPRNYTGPVIQLSGKPPPFFIEEAQGEEGTFTAEGVSKTRGRCVRPLFYQRAGKLEYVWFGHGAAVPAILYDHVLQPRNDISYSIHSDCASIHVWHGDGLIGFILPCDISAPEVVRNATMQLRINALDVPQTTQQRRNHVG